MIKKTLMKTIVATMMLSLSYNMVQANNLKLNTTDITITENITKKLKVFGTKAKVKWTSNNKKIATVSTDGAVKGIKKGTTYINAKVGKKTLKCKVTVKEKEIPLSNQKISYELKDTGKGIVAIMTNNNTKPVRIDAKMVFFKAGKMVGTSSDNCSYLAPNQTTVAHFYSYDVKREYDDYKLNVSVAEPFREGTNKIKIVSDKTDNNVTAEVTNNSGRQLDFIHLAIIYYDQDENAIGFENRYAHCNDIDSTDYVTFNFPYDENYNTIIPDSYKIYLKYATYR